MCGILGSINIENTAVFLDEIKHRGPDASGAITINIKEHSVSLLHRRLSIVDLSEAGGQPMASANGERHIVFNGEIYNHPELREALSIEKFNGHSDTETIVNYFSEFPILEALSHLNGIFAIAYLDTKENRLYLARDRFGVKPLYYFFDGEKLIFSSEIRPIKSCIDVTVNKGALLNSQRMRFTPSPLTVYNDVKKVEPGQIISFDLSGVTIEVQKEYFVRTPRLGSLRDDEKKLTNTYGDLFEKAVERQLMADVDVGILLSGGVDSALVAAIAQKKSKQKIKAFTIGFEGAHTEIDEIEYARETADVLGLSHYPKKIEFTDFLTSLQKIVEVVEEPIATTSIIPMYFLSELAASQVKVVLSGQGADEPLGGYYKYKALAFLEKARNVSNFSGVLNPLDFLYKDSENRRRFFMALKTKDDIRSWMEYNAVSSFEEIAELLHPSFVTTGMESLKKIQEVIFKTWKNKAPSKCSLTNLFLYCDTRASLSDDLLMYTDKITMNYGLECRVPILDNDLMAFIESIDAHYKFNAKSGKIIHKAFASAYLPTEIINRKKLGFQSPTETWFREKTVELSNIFTKNDIFKTLFDIDKVNKLLLKHKNGKNLEKQIFLLLSLNYLLKK